jgi:hypothetical protein
MSYELHVEVSKMSIIVTVAVVAGLAALLIAALLSVAHDLLSRFVLESDLPSNEVRIEHIDRAPDRPKPSNQQIADAELDC